MNTSIENVERLLREERVTMAQNTPHFCPRCGAPVMAGQRVCANCGLDLSPRGSNPNYPPFAQQPSYPPGVPFAQSPSYPPEAPFPAQTQIQGPPARNTSDARYFDQPAMPPSMSAQPPRKKRSRRGLIIGLLLIVVLLVGAYAVAAVLGVPLPGISTIASQPAVTTTNINQTVNYAGVDITILNAQQSDRFINDPNTSTDGMLRLNLKEQNNTGVRVSWLYTNSAHLILPGGSTVAPVYVKAKVGITPGATQTSMVDFAVPTGTNVSKVILRLSTASEAQMDIPLTTQANLSKYKPTTVKLNGQMQYLGLDWTLTQATSQLHTDGQQASKGMRYIVLTLSVDNTLSQEAIPGSPYSYMRLKSANTLLTPVNSTLPTSFATGETGKTGTVTFLAPQNRTAFTLLLQPQGAASGFNPDSADFQIA